MYPLSIKEWTLIGLSFLVGFLLTILPLPDWIVWWRPQWTLLILISWCLLLPNNIGIIFTIIVGLIMDLLTGTLLGQHALIYLIAAYFVLKFHLQFRHFPLWQQSLLVALFSLFSVIVTAPDTWKCGLTLLTTPLLWPWVYTFLNFRHEHIKQSF